MSSILSISARRALTSTRAAYPPRSTTRRNATIPLTSAAVPVERVAHPSVVVKASAEGFKAGVLYTVLAGSVATAAILLVSPSGGRTVRERDLL